MKITRNEAMIVAGLAAIFIGAPLGISSHPLLGLVLIFTGVFLFATGFLKSARRYR